MSELTGSVAKRTRKSGVKYEGVINLGTDPVTGKRQRHYLPVCNTKAEANKILQQALNEMNQGTYVEASKLTTGELLDDWLAVHVEPNLAANTVSGYKVNINNHIKPEIGNIKLQQLTPRLIQDMYSKLKQQGLSPKSIKYIHGNLKSALKYAYRSQLVSTNAADMVSPPKQVKAKTDIYGEDEVKNLLDIISGHRIEIPVNLAVTLGLRRGEALGLKWSDIDFDKNTIKICRSLNAVDKQLVFSTPKTTSGIRTLTMPSGLISLLKAHKAHQAENKLLLGKAYKDDDLVCCLPDGSPINPGSLSHNFKDFLAEHELKHIRFHDLRHTNATLMLQYGVPAKVASTRLGHANIQITLDTYTHVLPEMQEEAAEKLDKGIFQDRDIQVC